MSCSKVPYPTQQAAMAAFHGILRANRGRNRKVPTGTHLCSQCRAWHVTSKSGHQVPPWKKGAKVRTSG